MPSLITVSERSDKSITVCINDRLVTRYKKNPDGFKPYLSELCTPNGYNVLSDSPEGHPHHHGIWLGHASVNGINFWTEDGDEAKIQHREVLAKLSGEDRAIFAVGNDWLEPDGRKILEDELTYIVHRPVEHGYQVDLVLTVRATKFDVHFSKTEQSGFPFIRVADPLDVGDGGCITNADGMVNEAATCGKSAPWCDYSGPCGNGDEASYAGLSMYGHPDNPTFPTIWFTRDYGAFAPDSLYFSDGLTLRRGEELMCRYRLYVHDFTALKARVSREHDRYLEVIGMAPEGA